jgi:hypothetical protein
MNGTDQNDILAHEQRRGALAGEGHPVSSAWCAQHQNAIVG